MGCSSFERAADIPPIPEGMPESYELKIVGRPEDGPSVSFLKEYNEAASWQAGQSKTASLNVRDISREC